MDVRDKLASTIEWEADWRERRSVEYPEDGRNAAAAAALRILAGHVLSLAPDDARIVPFGAFTDEDLDYVVLGEAAKRYLSRVGFDRPADPDATLEHLAQIAQDKEVEEYAFELADDEELS